MEIGTALSAAWSSGISVYAVLATLGLAGRFDLIEGPPALQHWWVIGLALALFLVEFVIDKIAYLDSGWDAVHTLIRPAVGGWIVANTVDTTLPTWTAAGIGVALALSSHGAKAATRALVNASPEPASNVVVSLVEDGVVAGVMALALAYPRVAGVVAVVLGLVSAVVAVVLARSVRRLVATMRQRSQQRRGRAANHH